MEKYTNLNGNSGVKAYKINNNSIVIIFSTDATYVYSYLSAGMENIEIMKNLAREIKGLNSFINRNVKLSYSKKIN